MPENVTRSPETWGVVMVALKFPAASSPGHARISSLVLRVPVPWVTTTAVATRQEDMGGHVVRRLRSRR